MNAPQTRLDEFLMRVAQLGALRGEKANYRLFSDLKRELEREFPALHPSAYTRAVQAIATAAGV